LCGDNKRDPGEQCDAGDLNSNLPGAPCRPDCSLPRCSDLIVDPNEQCDDGNLLAGDGCDQFCRREAAVAGVFPLELFGGQYDFPYGVSPTGMQTQFPSMASLQALPGFLSAAQLAELQALTTQRPPTGDTGPAAIAIMAGGAAMGWALSRRKKQRK